MKWLGGGQLLVVNCQRCILHSTLLSLGAVFSCFWSGAPLVVRYFGPTHWPRSENQDNATARTRTRVMSTSVLASFQ